jgi:hypothetical protein
MFMNIKILILKIKSWFVKKPTNKLTWSCEDYIMGKRWAKCQPHPFIKGKTMWDLVYDKYDSTYTIDNLNKFLFNEL